MNTDETQDAQHTPAPISDPDAAPFVDRIVDTVVEESPRLTADAQSAPPREHILQFFDYEHLPLHLQAVSEPFFTLAHCTVMAQRRSPERTVALRKLLESKDACVRAALAR